MKFFLILKEDGGWFFSPFAEVDKPEEVGEVLQPALPLSVVERLVQEVQGPVKTYRFSRVEAEKRIMKALRREIAPSALEWDWSEVRAAVGTPECPQEFERRVRGRQLTDGDLGWLAEEMHVSQEMVWRWTDILVRRGEGEWLPAVRQFQRHWQCQRCGGEDVEEWPSVFGLAATCKDCLSLGPATSLGVLFRSRISVGKFSFGININYSFQSHFALTPAQERAAAELLQFVTDPLGSAALIWAACGAGKTEVGFPSIDWALRHGRAVLFAAPRQDVVLDVAPRLQRNFLGLGVPVLTGRTPGISRGSLTGGLVVATTHQVLRFYQAFALIILDEIDAFPYAGSRALAWGLRQALQPGGKIVCMTATPTKHQIQSVEKERGSVIRLPARHHRHPLPVPTWERLNFRETGELALARDEARFWIKLKDLSARGPVLLFVPKIAWVNPWVERLRRGMPQATVAGSFSADPERQAKVTELQAGGMDFFISTSILERGVTIEGVQVIVMAADHAVFDERSLVQMAGRVGRSPREPEGEVFFWSGRKTAGIDKAIHWIKEQNALALAQGLID